MSVFQRPPRPPSSIANTSYYSLDSTTPIASEFPTPTQSPILRPSDISQHTVEPSEHTITRIDMSSTAAATENATPTATTPPALPPRSPSRTAASAAATRSISPEAKSTAAEAGPSTTEPVEESREDDGPAPRYSSDHKPAVPVSDMKKSPVEDAKADSGTVVSSPSSAGSQTPGSKSAFGMGPGASGPPPPKGENEVLHQRAAIELFSRHFLVATVKDAKRVSKILKSEQKAEDKSMKKAIKELDKLSAVQRQAAKDESSAASAHNKAVKAEHKLNMKYLAAKAAWEKATADLRSKNEMLNSTKEHARAQTELLQAKTKEVDQLRIQKATDDRERQAKLLALKNPSGKAMTK